MLNIKRKNRKSDGQKKGWWQRRLEKKKRKKKEEKEKGKFLARLGNLYGLRMLITIIVMLFILLYSFILGLVLGFLFWYLFSEICSFSKEWSIGVAFLVGLIVSLRYFIRWSKKFLTDAIRELPADPPHRGILLFLGERTNKVLNEGFRLFPFFENLFDVIAINTAKKNVNLPPQKVQTPDVAELMFDLSFTWSAGSQEVSKKEQAKLLNTFIQSGREETVIKVISDVIMDRLRIWAFSKEEGPTTWQEAKEAKDDAVAVLVKAILGESIPSILSDIPTNVLLRYFDTSRKPPLGTQEKDWGKKAENGSDWERLEEKLDNLTQDEREELKRAVAERQKIIKALKTGNGSFVHKNLGITIHLLTINDVSLIGEVADTVQGIVKEQEERRKELIEMEGVSRRIKFLLENHPEIDFAQAVELVQTEQTQKVTKNISETKLNASAEFLKSLEVIATALVPATTKSSQ